VVSERCLRHLGWRLRGRTAAGAAAGGHQALVRRGQLRRRRVGLRRGPQPRKTLTPTIRVRPPRFVRRVARARRRTRGRITCTSDRMRAATPRRWCTRCWPQQGWTGSTHSATCVTSASASEHRKPPDQPHRRVAAVGGGGEAAGWRGACPL